jgi:phosphate-selective porin
MMRVLTVLALALAMTASATLRAHEGHAHKVLGTVTAIAPAKVTVKTQDGKTVTVDTDAKTGFARGTKKVDFAAMKVGDRVVIDLGDGAKMLAKSVRLGATK